VRGHSALSLGTIVNARVRDATDATGDAFVAGLRVSLLLAAASVLAAAVALALLRTPARPRPDDSPTRFTAPS
jgi:hypothetical protein